VFREEKGADDVYPGYKDTYEGVKTSIRTSDET